MIEPLSVEILNRTLGSDKELIWLEIGPEGDLHMEGQDLGPAAEEAWGRDEYEYTVKVSAADKDRLLMELLKEKYLDTRCSQDFKDWLTARNISYEFTNR